MNINLSELTIDNIGQWPTPVKYIVVGIIMLLLVAVGYWVIVKPNFEQYAGLQTEEISLKEDFENKQQLAANLDAYKSQLLIMNERFGAMLKQLPAQNEMPGLLEDISKTGVASGLVFELFAPMPEIVHDFYVELPINIIVVGSYQQLAVFISRVAEMNRIVTLHDFDIVPAPDKLDKTKKGSGDLLEMTITAKIYRYRAK